MVAACRSESHPRGRWLPAVSLVLLIASLLEVMVGYRRSRGKSRLTCVKPRVRPSPAGTMETSEQEHVAVDVTASFKPAAKGRTQGTERPSESDVPQRPPSCRKVLLDWTQHPPRSPRSRSRPYSSLHPPALRSAEFAATDPTWSAASPTAPAHFTTLSGPRQCQRLCPRRSNSDPHPAAECRLAQLRQAQVRSRVMIELVEIHPVMAGRWSSLSRSVRNCR